MTLAEFLKSRNVTQREIARLVGVTPSAVSQWLSGQVRVRSSRARVVGGERERNAIALTAIPLGTPFLDPLVRVDDVGDAHPVLLERGDDRLDRGDRLGLLRRVGARDERDALAAKLARVESLEIVAADCEAETVTVNVESARGAVMCGRLGSLPCLAAVEDKLRAKLGLKPADGSASAPKLQDAVKDAVKDKVKDRASGRQCHSRSIRATISC